MTLGSPLATRRDFCNSSGPCKLKDHSVFKWLGLGGETSHVHLHSVCHNWLLFNIVTLSVRDIQDQNFSEDRMGLGGALGMDFMRQHIEDAQEDEKGNGNRNGSWKP